MLSRAHGLAKGSPPGSGRRAACAILQSTLCTDGHGNPTSLWVQPPTSGGLQNLPAELEVAPNGERVVVGLWGSGGGEPELVLLTPTSGIPIAVADLPGSVHAMDLGADGTRVALGIKQVHANQYGTTGAVLLFDTGERDLQQLSAAYLGGELRILSVGASSSTEVYFFGTSSESALAIPGLSGGLRLRVDLPVAIFSALADPLGRAELALPIPNQASLAGLAFAVQSLTLGGAHPGFSETRFAPILL